MIETINIWKRSHDGKFSVCFLVRINQLGVFGDCFRRYKETRDTLDQILLVVLSYQEKFKT